MTYLPRIVDHELVARLASAGAVLIEGPKFSGKTATAKQHCASAVFLDTDTNARGVLSVDPSLVLEGDTPRLIDEWQVEPAVWNHVRRLVDERRQPGQVAPKSTGVSRRDVNADGLADFVVQVPTREMRIAPTDTTLCMTGMLQGGAELIGCDGIRQVPAR